VKSFRTLPDVAAKVAVRNDAVINIQAVWTGNVEELEVITGIGECRVSACGLKDAPFDAVR